MASSTSVTTTANTSSQTFDLLFKRTSNPRLQPSSLSDTARIRRRTVAATSSECQPAGPCVPPCYRPRCPRSTYSPAACKCSDMTNVRVEAVRVADDSQSPRIVEFRLTDVVTIERDFHVPSWVHIPCTVDAREGDRATVTLEYGVVDDHGDGTFVVPHAVLADVE